MPVEACGFVEDGSRLKAALPEELFAKAFKLVGSGKRFDWGACSPRSFSILPVAMACQARCPFCFSKASASSAAKQSPMDPKLARRWARAAKRAGAERGVVTGGGEPLLASRPLVLSLVEALAEELGYCLLISNGFELAKLGAAQGAAFAKDLKSAGLGRIAISRHGSDRAEDAKAMGLKSSSAQAALRTAQDAGLQTRSICVMQKGFVDSPGKIRAYIERSASEGVDDICFKELYVSSLSENQWAASAANLHAAQNQAPLSMAIRALEEMGFKESARLPWGAPVYEGEAFGLRVSAACYTEPSTGWELANGLARSWNLMADGRCLASLEDPASLLTLEHREAL